MTKCKCQYGSYAIDSGASEIASLLVVNDYEFVFCGVVDEEEAEALLFGRSEAGAVEVVD